ncbi:MAG: UDP-N-acetylmuramoyl-L-alanyl-D-glutamate--2,6-diaminopimelate ligase [Verrucomicrobiota bacterium JB023]|nr:UDP-N-acetylmuramoyl-L-alanyl-D-glutamate--2,6-diaminopimelate ligase [Verrucomicrobiota bacterium JB023]
MKLEDLVLCLSQPHVSGPRDGVELSGVHDDSRQVTPGSLFVAVRGLAVDGHDYISKAVTQGAAAIVAETEPPEGYDKVWIRVKDSRLALANIADAWHHSPSRDLPMVGVTGTNGKTTIAYLVHTILKATRMRAGMIGTVAIDDGVESNPAKQTTPGALELQSLLARMRDNGCGGVVMEVSSHGLEQGRTLGVDFNVGVFTNLTQDHLDYHGTMENYFAAKKKLFTQMANAKGNAAAVINLDDRYGVELVDDFASRLNIVTYGFSSQCDFRAGRMKQDARGTEFQLEAKSKSFLVRVPLIGRFNVMNVLAALAAVTSVGVPMREALNVLKEMKGVPGRLELAGMKSGVPVFVDYAHTPDALQNVCRTLRELEPSRLITVFGCGGDRDRGKRAPMARAAEALSSFCIVTSDNPRGEEPDAIMREVEKGFAGEAYTLIEDREEAIRRAIEAAREGDIILIAGKGHEDYQIFSDRTIEFDDRKVARRIIDELRGKEARL